MTAKEAIVVVLDVGPSMSQSAHGELSALQESLDCIGKFLSRKMFSESKDQVALVLLGTPETANNLAESCGGYSNICLAAPLASVSWNLIEFVQSSVKPNDLPAGDLVDAIVVAIDHLMSSTQGRKGYSGKTLDLFTDFGGQCSDSQLDTIIASLQRSDIVFNVIGPSRSRGSDDSDSGDRPDGRPTPKALTAQQRTSSGLITRILEMVDGGSLSLSEALSDFTSRQVKPRAWNCPLEITQTIAIPTSSFTKTRAAAARPFSQVSARDATAETRRQTTLHLRDEAETEIGREDIIEGHRYGSTLVPFTADDKEAMKLKTSKCFSTIGFTSSKNVKRHQFLGESTMMVFADKTDEVAGVAFSALVHALYETNCAMIVRKVYVNNAAPKIGCLVPHIKNKYQCLVYNELPFSDDLRHFPFNSLPLPNSENTANGKWAKLVPSDAELTLVDEFIDDMNLMTCSRDEDGEFTEAEKPKSQRNPYLQKLYECLHHRALNPDAPLCEFRDPPPGGATASDALLSRLAAAFPPDARKRPATSRDNMGASLFRADGGPAAKRQAVDSDVGLDGSMATLGVATVTQVGSVSPVEDFRALIHGKDKEHFDKACHMMVARVQQMVSDSFGQLSYEKATDCLRALRAECLKAGDPLTFNSLLTSLRDWASSGRADFWRLVCAENIGLVRSEENSLSDVSQAEAEAFLRPSEATTPAETVAPPMDDPEDLLDCL